MSLSERDWLLMRARLRMAASLVALPLFLSAWSVVEAEEESDTREIAALREAGEKP
jgi:hypothetical protein